MRLALQKPWCVRTLGILAALVPLLLAYSATAQEVHPTEAQVKAAYLYNFGKFVTWPDHRAGDSGSFQICILGRDPFGKVLDSTVSGEKINDKPIVTRRISRVQEAQACNILFISTSDESRLPAILPVARAMNLLTVSDMPNFANHGGTIGLVLQEEKVRFEVNRTAAEEAHLVLSSQLLKVASKVIEKGTPGN
jgi:hypothetical protein